MSFMPLRLTGGRLWIIQLGVIQFVIIQFETMQFRVVQRVGSHSRALADCASARPLALARCNTVQ
jgi:hypothetical protein